MVNDGLGLLPALLELDSKQKQIAVLPQDPLPFLKHVSVIPWQEVGFSPDQDKIGQIALGLEEFDQVVVEAGKGVGKSITVAALAAWFLTRFDPATVVTLAPSHEHLKNVLWRNIRYMARRHKLPGNIFETQRWDIHEKRFMVGLSPRRDKPEDLTVLQGYHSPNLLVIMDEATGFNRLTWDTVRGLVTASNNKVLAIGNPIGQAGPFFDACNSPHWKHIRISCLEHPNVVSGQDLIPGATNRKWVERYIADHCAKAGPGEAGAFEWFDGLWYLPDAIFQAQVMGVPPAESSDQLISLTWVLGAMGWVAEPDQAEETVIGFDASRVASGDMAAMILRKGPLVKWVKRRRPNSQNPGLEFAGWLKEEYSRTGAGRIFIDGVGVGASVVDQARRLGLPVQDVNFGSGSGRRNFANKRAECWWRLREMLQGGALSLPQDDLLAGDLTAPKFWYDGQGRILLEPKDQIRSRLGRSPDSGDSLALTFALDRGGGRPDDEERGSGLAGGGRWGLAGRGRSRLKEGGRWKR